ncbi:MAG: hypothetical protein ABI379_09390 [Rhodanobacter sp.]
MKRLFASTALSAAVLLLAGCYVDPGYSYVRRTGYQGDAYYGQAMRGYEDGYYAAPLYGSYYGGGYGYGYGYGCCYTPGVRVGVSAAWYDRARYYGNGNPGYRRYDSERGNRDGWRDGADRDGSRDGPNRGGSHNRPGADGARNSPNRGGSGPVHGEHRQGENRTGRDHSREP